MLLIYISGLRGIRYLVTDAAPWLPMVHETKRARSMELTDEHLHVEVCSLLSTGVFLEGLCVKEREVFPKLLFYGSDIYPLYTLW